MQFKFSLIVLMTVLGLLVACETQKGTYEKAGEEVDKAMQDVKESSKKVAENAREAAEDVSNSFGEALEDAGDFIEDTVYAPPVKDADYHEREEHQQEESM